MDTLKSLIFVTLFTFACQPSAEHCVPGESAACACPDGSTSAQACSTDGSFLACECSGAVNNAKKIEPRTCLEQRCERQLNACSDACLDILSCQEQCPSGNCSCEDGASSQTLEEFDALLACEKTLCTSTEPGDQRVSPEPYPQPTLDRRGRISWFEDGEFFDLESYDDYGDPNFGTGDDRGGLFLATYYEVGVYVIARDLEPGLREVCMGRYVNGRSYEAGCSPFMRGTSPCRDDYVRVEVVGDDGRYSWGTLEATLCDDNCGNCINIESGLFTIKASCDLDDPDCS